VATADDLIALTLWRPWAWSVAAGLKRIENRGWKPPASLIGKRLAIHAGEKWDPDANAVLRAGGIDVPSKGHHYTGAILGLVVVRGALAPWAAGLGMALSSLLVVANALRLARP